MSEVVELLKEAQEELTKVDKKLMVKEGGIHEKLKFKTRKLKKDKEKLLDTYKLQMSNSERKVEAEKAAIKSKLTAIEKKAEADAMAHSLRIEILEKRLEEIATNHSSLLETLYYPLLNNLYETDEECKTEDINLPVAFHELSAQKASLEGRIKMLKELLASEKDASEAQLEEAHKKAMERDYASDLAKAKAKADVKLGLCSSWYARQKRIIHSQEGLPPKADYFWTREAQACMDEFEFKHHGDLYEQTKARRQHITEERQLQREAEDKQALRKEEAHRTKELEKAKVKS